MILTSADKKLHTPCVVNLSQMNGGNRHIKCLFPINTPPQLFENDV